MPEFDRDTWQTPLWLFYGASFLLGEEFTLDAFASDINHLCDHYYTKDQDSYNQSWQGQAVFCNPPYSKGNIEKCLRKCHEERRHTKGIAAILPFDICAWGKNYLWGQPGVSIFVLDKRIKFVNPLSGQDDGSPRNGTMIITFKNDDLTAFNMIKTEELKELGLITLKKAGLTDETNL